jgi:hypothetical protein
MDESQTVGAASEKRWQPAAPASTLLRTTPKGECAWPLQPRARRLAERDLVATRFTWRSDLPDRTVIAQGGAILRFADGQIVECWNLPAEMDALVA